MHSFTSRTTVWVSAASVWEISIKHSLGRGDMPVSDQETVCYFREQAISSWRSKPSMPRWWKSLELHRIPQQRTNEDRTMTNTASAQEAHRHVSFHRAEIEASTLCACGYCHERYPPTAIHQWADWLSNVPAHERSSQNGQTAICPHCCIDAVLPETIGLDLSSAFLADFYRVWFEGIIGAGQ